MSRDPWQTAGDIRVALIGIRNVWPAVINASRSGNSDRVSGSAAIPAAVAAHILDVRIEAQKDLRFYTMLILNEINGGGISTKVDVLDIDSMGIFIDTWALHLCEQMPDDSEDCRRDLQKQATRLLEMVRGDQTHRYQIGRCPELTLDEAQTRCTGELLGHHAGQRGTAAEADPVRPQRRSPVAAVAVALPREAGRERRPRGCPACRRSRRGCGVVTLIDTEVAALMLRCTDRHVRRLVAAGKVLNHGTTRRLLLDLDAVATMSASLCSDGTSVPREAR